MVFEATDLDDDDKMSKTEFKNLIQVSNSLSVCFAKASIGFNEKLDLRQYQLGSMFQISSETS